MSFSGSYRHYKTPVRSPESVLTVAEVPRTQLEKLLRRYGLTLIVQPDREPITGSYWGDSEAGIVGHNVYVRGDTPVHSLLHESCHTICMTGERRAGLDTNAGGDDLEEAAVCYLQIVLAEQLPGVGSQRLMRDMDSWGYSFRLGSTARWFFEDASDEFNWLIEKDLLTPAGRPVFCLRR